MNRKVSKQKENDLALAIQDAIDEYCEAGCKDFLLTEQNYDLGYEIKLSIKKQSMTHSKAQKGEEL